MADHGATGRRGRPRDASVDERAMSVAWELLLAGGYAGLNVDEVAERAAVAASLHRYRTARGAGGAPASLAAELVAAAARQPARGTPPGH